MRRSAKLRLALLVNNPSLTNEVTAHAHSMVRALPECQSLIWSFGGTVQPTTRAAFPDGTEFASGMSRDAAAVCLRQWKPDIAVLMNTHPDRIPTAIGEPIRVFYQTSHTSADYKRISPQVSHYFCVSKWLAKQVGAPEESVLPPPAEAPPDTGRHNRTHVRLAGRAAPMGPHHWKPESYWKDCKAAKDAEPRLFMEFLGNNPKRPEAWCLPGHIGWNERYRLSTWDFLISTGCVEEAYSRTVAEAMRVGCVPIASNKGGLPEQIRHGEDGFLVNSPEEVAEAVFSLKDDETLKRMSENAKKSGDRLGSLKTWRTEFLKRLMG